MTHKIEDFFKKFQQQHQGRIDLFESDPVVQHNTLAKLYQEFKTLFIDFDTMTFNIKGHRESFSHHKTMTELDAISPHNYLFSKRSFDKYFFLLIKSTFCSFIEKNYLWKSYLGCEDEDLVLIYEEAACFDCGESLSISLDMKKNELIINPRKEHKIKQCPVLINENFTPSIQMEVPSGKLIVANDLREVLSEDIRSDIRKENISVDHYWGRKKEMNLYSKHNLFHVYVGNCDDVFVFENMNEQVITVYPRNDSVLDDSDSTYLDDFASDSRWFSAMDYDLYQKLCIANDFKCDNYVIINVGVGSFKFTSYTDAKPGVEKIISIQA